MLKNFPKKIAYIDNNNIDMYICIHMCIYIYIYIYVYIYVYIYKRDIL